MDAQTSVQLLENGIIAAHKRVYGTKVVHCAIMFDIGSRDELDHEVGLAHMWEHMAFKGTIKRSAYQVLTSLDSLGGELNAFTTKEKICFHASVLDVHVDKAIDVLTDIAFHSIFPDKELEKEKKVVLEEISMYYDAPEDAIQDEFESILFAHHPMGNNILGTNESIPLFGKSHFLDFISRNLSTDKVAFVTTGDFSAEQAFKKVKAKLEAIPAKRATPERKLVNGFTPSHEVFERPIQQAHCILGARAMSLYHPDKYKLMLLNNILGGPASNSLLYLSLREKHGYVYSVESNYHAFCDTGAFQVYFATDPKQVNRCLDLVKKQIKALDELLQKKAKLSTYKQQIKGQLAMSEENNQAYMLMMARSLLDLGKIEDIEMVFEDIDTTTAEELLAIRKEHLDPDKMASLVLLPGN